jgi:hypothetical protein
VGVAIIVIIDFCLNVDASFFRVDLLAGTVYIHLGNFDDYHVFKPKIEVWKEEKCNRFKDDGSFMTSFEDKGTIERIQQLLENLDQRG